jgi:galactose mutarotase-like enzyme
MSDTITIRGDGLSAGISPLGAELQWLRDGEGRELLWDGDPVWWSGRAPILFPIVGGLKDDRYRLDGEGYTLPKHGFARFALFDVIEQGDDAVTFRLTESGETLAAWPFRFRLDLRFAIAAGRLEMSAIIANPGDRAMPFSFGFHPAFRWPLPFGGARADHRMMFDGAVPDTIRRVALDGLMTAEAHATPVKDGVLALDDDLFVDDALIFLGLATHGLTYGVPGESGLRIIWDGLPDLGIWMKPGANYVCVEPWSGHASPADFTGELREKPGIMELAPGAERRFGMSVGVTG